jgi:hypothetical protein
MRFSTLALSTLILMAPASAFAQDHMGGGMHGFFTPEQRAMYMQTNHLDFSSMSHDQRHEQMQVLRAKFEGMSDADKAKLKADMQAKFDALTPDQKKAVEDKIAERQAHWHNHGGDHQQ